MTIIQALKLEGLMVRSVILLYTIKALSQNVNIAKSQVNLTNANTNTAHRHIYP